MSDRTPNVAVVSSYIPRQCGIATFSNDLATNLAEFVHHCALTEDPHLGIVAVNDSNREYQYGPQVQFVIRQHQRSDYRNAADFLNAGSADIINLQHEYGLFGGNDGAMIIELLERLDKPIAATFHTVLSEPGDGQRRTLARIAELSSVVVPLAQRARSLLTDVYGVPDEKIRVIPHGTPDVAFHNPEDFKDRFKVRGRPVILTFGLLGPSKGIETMLQAMAQVVPQHPDVAYMILGATHPGVVRESGESYRLGLERLAVDLGLSSNVFFHNHYVNLPLLLDFLKAADLYVTPYRSKEQIVSGTLAFAVACGKAVVSTPYWYAQELLADGRGCLVDFNDAAGLARAIGELLSDPRRRLDVRKRAYAFGRQMIWPVVAREYDAVFSDVIREHAPRVQQPARRKAASWLSLPEVRLDHLFRLSDDTGILQHATYASPDRNHGYCTDDNARALLVAAMSYRLLANADVLPYLDRYLSFLHHAWNAEHRSFRNFMAYDRTWLDEQGSEGCHSRAIWALGYLISHPPGAQDVSLATELFHRAAGTTRAFQHLRARAVCVLGFSEYLRHDDAPAIRELMTQISNAIYEQYSRNQSDDWVFPLDTLTYNNARVPQSLILAGDMLQREDLLECGIRSLRWLLETHITPDGQMALVGNRGWWQRGQEKAAFDQQPIDAAAFVGACKAAYKATGDAQWLTQMRACFDWFLGRNALGLSLVDFKTRGCCDGLAAHGVNLNQGAESTLSWLLSLLIMYEMHPGKSAAGG